MNANTSTEVTFQREPLEGILEAGVQDLLHQHWREVAHDQDVIRLRPRWGKYLQAEREGTFVAFTLRRGEKLIGYNAFIVAESLHYEGRIFAVNDVIFLLPDERGVEGIGLIICAERYLRAGGITKIFYHIKTNRVLGQVPGDSLDAIEGRLEIERRFGVILPDEVFGLGDKTVGAVLGALGYKHVENNWAKMLAGGQ